MSMLKQCGIAARIRGEVEVQMIFAKYHHQTLTFITTARICFIHGVFHITRVWLVSTYSISSTSLVWRAVLQWQSPHIEGSAPKHYDNHQIVATSCHCAWHSFHKETSEVALLKRRWWVNLRRSKPFGSYFCV